MKRQINTYSTLFILLTLLAFSSCRIKKFIPEGEYLYRGCDISIKDTTDVKDKAGLESELETLVYPKPNKRVLGLYPGLHYYYRAQTEKPGFIVRYLNKKIGEEPVYLSNVKIDKTEELMENRLENRGFFITHISSNTYKDTSSKTAKCDYEVVIGKPYQLNNYILEVDSLEQLDSFPIYEELQNSLSETFLKKGSRYDLNSFKNERERIDYYLKRRGYYNFSASFIIFQVDTNLNKNKTFNLYLKLKIGVPAKSKVPYEIKKIEVFPFTLNDTAELTYNVINIDGITFVQDDTFFKPKRLNPFILLSPNEPFDPVKSKNTSKRLSSIGTFKFVNINFTEVDSVGSDSFKKRYLNATITLSPFPKRAIQVELKGVTKSNNFTGPNFGVTYLNRNIFKGGENFTATGSIGYEKQFGNNTNGSTSLQMGVNTSLILPRLIAPGNMVGLFNYTIPKTKISVGIDYFRRSELYSLNSYSASFGYTWNANKYITHNLNPIEVNYLQLGNRSDLFNSILDENPFLKRSFEQQFIAGLTYSFFFNNLGRTSKRGRFNLKINYEMAGNSLNLLDKESNPGEPNTVLGLAYSQYIKGDIDLSYHYALSSSGHTIVGRVFAGIGIPYGNSESLPYVKQYFSGGSYSVRAFQIRGLGPGTYNPPNNDNLYFDRSGDIKLETNLEYRFPIISFLKGALFADAGNIWNLSDELEGGKFSSSYMDQIGVGTGLGLRVDVQGFVIRFDFAAPIKKPTGGWKFDYKNPVFNFAIGYPF